MILPLAVFVCAFAATMCSLLVLRSPTGRLVAAGLCNLCGGPLVAWLTWNSMEARADMLLILCFFTLLVTGTGMFILGSTMLVAACFERLSAHSAVSTELTKE